MLVITVANLWPPTAQEDQTLFFMHKRQTENSPQPGIQMLSQCVAEPIAWGNFIMSTCPVKNNVLEGNKQSLQGQDLTTAPQSTVPQAKLPTETSKQFSCFFPSYFLISKRKILSLGLTKGEKQYTISWNYFFTPEKWETISKCILNTMVCGAHTAKSRPIRSAFLEQQQHQQKTARGGRRSHKALGSNSVPQNRLDAWRHSSRPCAPALVPDRGFPGQDSAAALETEKQPTHLST